MDQSPGSEASDKFFDISLLWSKIFSFYLYIWISERNEFYAQKKKHNRELHNSLNLNPYSVSVLNVSNVSPFYIAEKIVEPNQQDYPWYHQEFRRVPTIDQCYTDDVACHFEANQQFRRDKMVENEILNILRQRFEDCVLYEAPDHMVKCKPVYDTYEKAVENWFTKCELNVVVFFIWLFVEAEVAGWLVV